jgi:predicted nucleic acid-binding protein
MTAMIDKIFVDSNVWLYIFLEDDTKKWQAAEKYISENEHCPMVISYQVINEVASKLLKKKVDEAKVDGYIELLFKVCTIHNFSKNVILQASSLRKRYSFSFWDSMIVASALSFGCSILASEDMQDGLKIDNMTIRNIF